ncbi:MAG: ABC transporter substrate-binding protein [Candidatus Methanomethylophilaceae archaeon]|nr:ABC transporter substrate-binding protein [Candidatus Methanomethylophilaceae archaeon]
MAISTKVIAVIVVLIIAIGGVAAFALLQNKDKSSDQTVDPKDDDNPKEDTPQEDLSWKVGGEGRLQVYGNANMDDVMDDKDLKAISYFMSKGWTASEYPYADANMDGKVDQSDYDIVDKILKKQEVDIYYIDGLDETKVFHYPLTKLILGGNNTHAIVSAVGAYDKAVARTGTSSLDSTYLKYTYDLPSVGAKAYNIDLDEASKYTFNTVITLSSSTYDAIVKALEGTPINCVRINPDSNEKNVQTYLLLGFLTDHVDQAQKIAAFYDKWNPVIAENVKKITQQKTTISKYTGSMTGMNYYLTQNTVSAGAINLSDFDANTMKFADNKEKFAEEKYQAEYIVQYLEIGFNPQYATQGDMQTAYNKYAKDMDLMKAFPKNYFIVNKDIQDIARTAYVAQYLYPEIFGEDFGDKLYAELVQVFFPYIDNFDVTKCYNLFDYQMAFVDTWA